MRLISISDINEDLTIKNDQIYTTYYWTIHKSEYMYIIQSTRTLSVIS